MVNKWWNKPEWWAVTISAVSLISSGIIAYFSFFQPPKLEIISFMPVLLDKCEKPSEETCHFGGVLEVFNASNFLLSVKEMSIAGELKRQYNPFNNESPLATEFVSIIGTGLGDSVLKPHSTGLIRFEFIDFSKNPKLQFSNVPTKEIVEFMKSHKPIKVGRYFLNFEQLIETSDGYLLGLSDNLKSEKLSFYVLINQKYQRISKEKVLGLRRAVGETWQDLNRIQEIHRTAKSMNSVSQKVWDKE